MPTFDLISSTTLTGTSTSIVFSSIPQTYTDLELHFFGIFSANLQLRFKVNHGTTSYTYRIIKTGSPGTSNYNVNDTEWTIPDAAAASANMFIRMTLDNYSNSTAEKSGTYFVNRDATHIEYGAIMKQNTAAIETLEIAVTQSSFAAGTTAHLYGIASS